MSFSDIASQMRKRADQKAAQEDAPPNFEEIYALRARILGVLIRDARQASELSLEQCAAQVGVSATTLEQWELGKAMPSLPHIELLAYVLNMPISHFWGAETLQKQMADRKINPAEYLELRQRLVGALLRSARENQSLSLETVAEAAGTTPSTITAYELGQRPIPVPVLTTLAATCNVNLSHFLENGNRVGTFLLLQEDLKNFSQLPEDMRHFVAAPVNQPYIDLAMKLAAMETEKLRKIAESILDITL